MAKTDQPTTIKKYANRRLYNTGTSTYVTLEDLAAMVKEGEDFLVYDAKTGEDITRSVLAQIIMEQEKFRKQLASTLSGTPFAPLEEQVRRNMELFQQTFSMFKPFAPARNEAEKTPEPPPPAEDSNNIDELRRQMKEMQDRLDRMSTEPKKEEGGG